MVDLLAAWSAGRLKPEVMKTFPLAEGRDALAEIANRRVTGKLVLEM